MQKRDCFIDIIKIYACILVVLGHFVQSIIKADFVDNTLLLNWFVDTISYFHVPLFFICSGYLFQKYSLVTTFSQWKNNFFKKLLALGVPYFVFSTVTWVFKTLFSSSVNDRVDGYFKSVFLQPISPYWYLYALILIFLIMPTFSNKNKALLGLGIALALKTITFLPFNINVYALNTVMQNLIWFVIGMCLSSFRILDYLKFTGRIISAVVLSFSFIVCSILLCVNNIERLFISFIMGLAGCIATLAFALIFADTKFTKNLSIRFSKYTMPVFLMHTIFAAGLRAVLQKVGISNSIIHIVLGLLISFIGPAIALYIMKKIKYLDFIIYPNKYIKIGLRGKK